MEYRGSRGGSRGGRGEALRRLLEKASGPRPQEEEPYEQYDIRGPSTVGVQGSSSQAQKPMGRSAALMKLLESSSTSRGGGSSFMSEATSYVPKREQISSRGTPRSSYPDTTTDIPSREPFSSGSGYRASFPEPSYPSSRGREAISGFGGMRRETSSFDPDEAEQRSFPSSAPSRGRDPTFGFRREAHSFAPDEAQQPSSRGRMKFIPSSEERETSPVRHQTRPTRSMQFAAEEETEEAMSQLSVYDDSDKPPVIKRGTSGREVTVASNYIRLKVEEGKGVFQYNVKFNPEVDCLNIRFKLMKEVVHIIGETKSFDGHILYLPIQLPEKITKAYLKLPTDSSDVTLTITFIKKLRLGDQAAVHLYNVLLRRIMRILGLVLHGRHFFDPVSAMPVPVHKLEVWPGYITTINEFEDGIMLCCDASHRVLRTQTVHELLEDIKHLDSRNWKEEFMKLIVGQTVLTRYNNKIYRVDDVAFEESPSDCFQRKDGTKISYVDYYRYQYNITIADKRQPLLKSKAKKTIKGKEPEDLVNLVPELCYLSGLTETMRADMRVMKDIAQCTRISPNQRQYALNEFVNNINTNKDVRKILDSWGLSLANNNIKLTARVMMPEDVHFGDNIVHKGDYNADWTKLASSSSVLQPVALKSWGVICTSRDEKVVNGFVDMFKRCAPHLGIKMHLPQMFPMPNDNIQTYIKALQSTKGSDFQILVIIFPLCREDKYSAVKKWCCVDNPIPSQVIQTRTIRKPERLRSITQKIALQMNCKLGGSLWAVEIPLKCSMVIGLDTFHDAVRQGNSVGAVVASLDKPLTRWYSKVYTQKPGLELISGLEVSILACLQKYKEVNGVYPEQILIYRDGVGDGQLKVVEEYELPQLITACRRISPNYDPKFLVVIVQKRISTRIFTEERKDYVNPAPGTVLDNGITRKEFWDFFLVSQNVRQGTVSPTHYIVLYNSTRMSPDQVQRLTYKLTYLYYNWTGTVRVPAPCLYAHKLAYLVGESIHKEAAEVLADKLFYL